MYLYYWCNLLIINCHINASPKFSTHIPPAIYICAIADLRKRFILFISLPKTTKTAQITILFFHWAKFFLY